MAYLFCRPGEAGEHLVEQSSSAPSRQEAERKRQRKRERERERERGSVKHGNILAHACNPSLSNRICKRIITSRPVWQKVASACLKKNEKHKG
jgi:hypothetical protein